MSSNEETYRYWTSDETSGTFTPITGSFIPYDGNGLPIDSTTWTIRLSAPCPNPNSPKCPVFEKYGFPGDGVKLSGSEECPHTKKYDCPYLIKMEGTELSEQDPKPEEGDPKPEDTPEGDPNPEPPQTPEPEPQTPQEPSPEIELASIRAQVAVLEADKARREDNEVAILLEEAKKISPMDVDKLVEPFSTLESKKVFLTSYITQMKDAGFPRKEEKKKLELSQEDYQKKESVLFSDLFGDVSEEDLIGQKEEN